MKARRDLVPLEVRFAVRDAVGGWGFYTVAQIGELFEVQGFTPAADFESTASGARRAEAERYQAAIDCRSPEQVDRYLRVAERILEDHDNEDGRSRYESLSKALHRYGLERDAKGRLRLPAPALADSARLAAVPTDSDIRVHLARLERLDQVPEEMIGAAKELVEATAKFVALELGETVDDHDDLSALSKRALRRLKLHPEAVAPTAKGSEVMVKLLGGLAQVAGGLAELRNMAAASPALSRSARSRRRRRSSWRLEAEAGHGRDRRGRRWQRASPQDPIRLRPTRDRMHEVHRPDQGGGLAFPRRLTRADFRPDRSPTEPPAVRAGVCPPELVGSLRRVDTAGPPIEPRKMLSHRRLADAELVRGRRDQAESMPYAIGSP